jgi:hypothetical protein
VYEGEAKSVCKDHRKWKEVISAYPKENGHDVMYVCMFLGMGPMIM